MRKLVLVSGGKRTNDSKNIFLKRRRIAILTVLLIIVIMLTAVIICADYAVCIDGQVVGTVENGGEIRTIIAEVEEDVSAMLGYDYEITSQVELKTTMGGSEGDVVDAFMRSVEEIDLMFVLEIDGEYALCAKSEEEITRAVEAVAARYAMGESSTVSFDNVITVRQDYAPVADIMECDGITEALDPKNGGEFAIKIRTIVNEMYTEAVAYSCEYVDDDQLYEGSSAVLTEGQDGFVDVTEKVEYVNGVEISRVQVSSVVTLQPVNQVVSVGTKFRPAWVSYGEYIWPTEGVISSYFGPRTVFYGYSDHAGLDIAAELDTPIVAADGGEVTYADEYYGYGLMIYIRHDNGEVTRYAHCNKLVVEEGQKVARGEIIAYMGETGVASGVHLHFEIQVDGEPVDPLERLPEQ